MRSNGFCGSHPATVCRCLVLTALRAADAVGRLLGKPLGLAWTMCQCIDPAERCYTGQGVAALLHCQSAFIVPMSSDELMA